MRLPVACLAVLVLHACTREAAPTLAPLAGGFEYRRLEEMTARNAAVALGDCDGDGRVEALFFDGLLVEFEGGSLRTRRVDLPLLATDPATLRLVDVDGDERLDLLAGNRTIELLRGTGPCQFGAPENLATLTAGYVAQLVPTDLDHDGLQDLVAGVREAPTTPLLLLRARAPGRFDPPERVASPGLSPNPQPAEDHFQFYALLADDLDEDGAIDLMALIDRSESFVLRGQADGGFAPDLDKTRQLAGRSPMALATLDYDRDGRVDHFISNIPLETQIYRTLGKGAWEAVGRAAGLQTSLAADWGAFAFDADLDGWTDLFVLRTESEHPYTPETPGLLHNRGDGTFAEEGVTTLPADRFDARGLACGDLEGNGQPDCVISDNATTVLAVNRLRPSGRWAGLRLMGRVSAPLPVGARVTVLGEPPQTFAYAAQSPTYTAHDDGLVIGLAGADKARVHIAWPSGLEQIVPLELGRSTTVREPDAWGFDQAEAPAGGAGFVRFRISKAALGATTVKVAIDGEGAFAQPPQNLGDNEVHFVKALSGPGTVRLRLIVDGRTLPARPSVRFFAR